MMKRGGNSAFIASGARTVDAWTQVVVGGRAWVAGTGERALWQWGSARGRWRAYARLRGRGRGRAVGGEPQGLRARSLILVLWEE